MPETTTLLAYIAVVITFVLMPGPSVLLTVAQAMSSGTRAGLMTAVGIAAGDLIHTALAVFGISALLMASAVAFNVLKYLGAAYLIYLSIKTLRQGASPMQLALGEKGSAWQAFKQGFVCEVLNPKSTLFFLAFLPQFVSPSAADPHVQLAVLGAVFIALGVSATCGYAFAAAHVARLLKKSPSFSKWQNRFVGSVYGALGVRLALQDR